MDIPIVSACFVFRFHVRRGHKVQTYTCCPTHAVGHSLARSPGVLSRPYNSSFLKTPVALLHRIFVQLQAMPVRSSLTFAILPRCVPGQAKERREENNRSGHSSISEPHLISATPLLGSAQCRGPRNCRCHPSPFAFRMLTRACKQTYGDVRRFKNTVY